MVSSCVSAFHRHFTLTMRRTTQLLNPSWEFLITLDYEWSVIRGHRPYRWTIWVGHHFFGAKAPLPVPGDKLISAF